ncbi:MAG: hypothetical protein KZQ80_17105 [Candidatus Thiodiazotropha sp. (ex Monitilora ramsayi)]|nr:hypothetical protein [Candidatus Thiodiazotropha sp. (ex Monitilora ramsayi)]
MRLAFVLLPIFLVACGGGNTPSITSPTPIDVNQQAKITTSSTVDFFVGVKERFSKELTDIITSIFVDGELLFQTGDIDLLVLNSCGGTKHITGSLDEVTSSGTLNIAFSDFQYCRYGGTYTFSGDVTVQVTTTEPYVPGGNITIPSDYTVTTNNLTVTFISTSFGMYGTIEYGHDTSNPNFDTITLVKNIDFQNSDGTASFTNFIYKFHHSSDAIGYHSGYWSYSYAGRLYDSDHGYIDISTINAPAACATIIYPSLCPLDPTAAGRIVMAGDNSNALITFTSNLDYISIDSDGDNLYEHNMHCTDEGDCL